MRILFFDIDGTLISTGGAGGAALRAAFRAEFSLTELRPVPFSGRTDRGIVRSLFELHGIANTPEHWDRVLRGYLERLPDELEKRAGCVLPGVVELLRQLDEQPDVRMGLLTGNLREGARIKLSHFELFEYFSFGSFGDDHHDRDDVARAALRAADDGNGLQPNDIWVIGDTPLDVQCARAIGARALAVTTGIHPRDELQASEPDVLLDDLSDFRGVLRLLR